MWYFIFYFSTFQHFQIALFIFKTFDVVMCWFTLLQLPRWSFWKFYLFSLPCFYFLFLIWARKKTPTDSSYLPTTELFRPKTGKLPEWCTRLLHEKAKQAHTGARPTISNCAAAAVGCTHPQNRTGNAAFLGMPQNSAAAVDRHADACLENCANQPPRLMQTRI